MKNVRTLKYYRWLSYILQAYRCPFCHKCYRREYFFNTNVEYCESVSMIFCFDLILARSYWNCSSMENLRCRNSAVSAVMMKWFYETVWSSLKASCWQKPPVEAHKIHLPFSCKRWTSSKIIRLDLSVKLRLYPNMKI